MESQKTITIGHAIMLFMGSVLGGGILILPSLTVAVAGPGSIFAWILIIVASLPIAMMFGYLSTAFPKAGGIAVFTGNAFGNHAGNITGWLYFFILPCGQPAVMLAGVYYFDYMFGLSREATLLIAYGIISLAIIFGMLGKKLAASVQFIIMVAILLIVAMTVILGLGAMAPDNFIPMFPNGYWAVGKALALIMWAYIGVENLSFLAEDFKNPEKDLLKSLIFGTLLTGLIYISVSLVTIGVITPDKWAVIRAPFAYIANKVSGVGVAAIAMLLALFIISASAMAFVWGGSNLCVSLAERKALPELLAKKKNDVPIAAMLFLWGLYTVAFLLIYVFKIDITILAKCVGASTLLTYILCALSFFKLLKKGLWSAVITLIVSTGMLFFFGEALLYPLLTVIIYSLYILFSQSKNKLPLSLDTQDHE
jgi:amino acid efflux transporter